jgi:hypothetical protein
MNIPRFRIRDIESVILSMDIYPPCKVSVEIEYTISKPPPELLHISFAPLSSQELSPCEKQVLDRDDSIKRMETPLRKAPPNGILPVLEKIKSVYIVWHEIHSTLPKIHRYSLGNRIDKLFVDLMEAVSTASFLSKSEKLPYVRLSIRKLDTIKILLLVLWETKSLDNKKYVVISEPIDEIGRMLGGWNGSLLKENSLAEAKEK